MRNTVNEAGNEGGSVTVVLPESWQRSIIPLSDCARHLARLYLTVPPDKRVFVSTLRQQLIAWDNGGNREGLRERIPKTINAIRGTAAYADKR